MRVFDPQTLTASTWRALTHRLSPGRFVLYALAAMGLFFFSVIVLDAPTNALVRGWPDYERAFFLWLTAFGKSDWVLIPSVLVWLLAAAGLRAPLAWRWRWALRGLAGTAGYVFVGVGLPGLLTLVFKRLVGRERPYVEGTGILEFRPFDLIDYTVHSFPSGHATTAIALAIVVFTLTNGRFRGVFLALGLLIGLSRIVVGDHYLTDVLGGLVVGTVSGVVIRDLFASRGWGMRVGRKGVHFRLHHAFRPLLARTRRAYSAPK